MNVADRSHKPDDGMHSGFFVGTYCDVLGGEDWAHAEERARDRENESNGSSITVGLGLQKVEFQRKEKGSVAFPSTTDDGMDPQHCVTCSALLVACRSYNKPFSWTP